MSETNNIIKSLKDKLLDIQVTVQAMKGDIDNLEDLADSIYLELDNLELSQELDQISKQLDDISQDML